MVTDKVTLAGVFLLTHEMKTSFLTQETFSQIFTYWFIIQLQTQISKNNTQNKDTQSYVPGFT